MSMFPHTITIYRHTVENGADAYSRQEVDGCYWYGSDAVTRDGNGAVESDSVTVVLNMRHPRGYEIGLSFRSGDKIVKGSGPEISAWKDLDQYDPKTIVSVQADVIGSTVDNITIVGR